MVKSKSPQDVPFGQKPRAQNMPGTKKTTTKALVFEKRGVSIILFTTGVHDAYRLISTHKWPTIHFRKFPLPTEMLALAKCEAQATIEDPMEQTEMGRSKIPTLLDCRVGETLLTLSLGGRGSDSGR